VCLKQRKGLEEMKKNHRDQAKRKGSRVVTYDRTHSANRGKVEKSLLSLPLRRRGREKVASISPMRGKKGLQKYKDIRTETLIEETCKLHRRKMRLGFHALNHG